MGKGLTTFSLVNKNMKCILDILYQGGRAKDNSDCMQAVRVFHISAHMSVAKAKDQTWDLLFLNRNRSMPWVLTAVGSLSGILD